MNSPLLEDGNKLPTRMQKFLTPPKQSSNFIAFFLFPLRYLLAFNKKVDDARKRGEKIKFDMNFEDLPPLLKLREAIDDDVEQQTNRMESIWITSKQNKTPINLYRLAYATIPGQINLTMVSLFFDAAFRLLYSFFMGSTINCLSRYFYARQLTPESATLEALRWETIYTSMTMILVILCYIYAERLFFSFSFQSGTKLRLIFMMLLYRKLHRISLSALNEVSFGRFLNIISVDLDLLDPGLHQFSIVCVAPFMLLIGLGMMWNHFGALSLLSMGIIFFYMPLQSFVVKLSQAPKKRKNKLADDRMKIMGEIIECIRTLKQYTWEQLFMNMALNIREEENKAQDSIQKVQSLSTSLSNTSVYVSLLITIYFYTIVGGNDLTAEKIFSSLLILSIMKIWCVQKFSEGMLFVVNFGLAQKRIIEVLNIQEIPQLAQKHNANYEHQTIEMMEVTPFDDQTRLYLESYTGFWSRDNFHLNRPVLRGINLNLTNDTKLTCVIGKIGSGKSSLLLSILKEVPYHTGEMIINGSIAYVEQEPYVFQGTIKDNILFGLEYDAEVYERVMRASCFEDDLRALPQGDQSYVGERGITLSGGQRARLSFARALYSNNDIYILDDPLSAVDAKVARNMFNKGIKQYLRGKIVVLVTHLIHFAVESNWMVLMHEGSIRAQGPPAEVLATIGSDFQQYVENSPQQRHSLSQKCDDPILNKVLSQLSQTMSVRSDDFVEEEKEKVEVKISLEDKQLLLDMLHEVSFKTLIDYFAYGGGMAVILKIYALFASDSLATILTNRLFGMWVKDNEDATNIARPETNHTIYIKGVFVLLLIIQVLSYFKFYTLQAKTLQITTSIYNCMVQVLVRAKVAYFDLTASGQVLSRFSTDLNMADVMLSQNLQISMEGLTNLILITLTVCIVNPIIFLPSFVFFVILYRIKYIFQPFMSYTRNCDSATRGPLNTEISSTLNGLIVIRAYQKADIYIQQFQKNVYRNTQSIMGCSRTNATLALICDLALCMQITFGTGLLIWFALHQRDSDPGEMGFSLLLLIQMGDNFSGVLRSFFQIEINLNHVERMFSLTRAPAEAALEQVADDQVSQKWPQQGVIEFCQVNMKYDLMRNEISGLEDKYALRSINFKVPSCSRIGIVGRTGAGKSSLLQALFRMVEIEPGSPNDGIFIDGLNVNQFGLHFLRKRISIIPQQPVVFQGSIRRNLDPLNVHGDAKIMDALQEVGLSDKILKLDKQLDTDMSISAEVFSVGQKQLICLARAMLQDNKIVVFDEATSNVDLKTDQFIQSKIKQRFHNCTVLTIAHRLETIADYDGILVMDQGQVKEYSHPFKLMVLRETDEQITNLEGMFAQMVLNTGKVASRKIFRIAQQAFMHQLTK